MYNNIKDISLNLTRLNKYSKRIVAIFIDITLCILSTWFAFVLYY